MKIAAIYVLVVMSAVIVPCADLSADTIRCKDGSTFQCEVLNIFDDRIEYKIGDEVRTVPNSSVEKVIIDQKTRGNAGNNPDQKAVITDKDTLYLKNGDVIKCDILGEYTDRIEYRQNGGLNSISRDRIDRFVRDGISGTDRTSKTSEDAGNGKTDVITLYNGEVIECTVLKVEKRVVRFRRAGETTVMSAIPRMKVKSIEYGGRRTVPDIEGNEKTDVSVTVIRDNSRNKKEANGRDSLNGSVTIFPLSTAAMIIGFQGIGFSGECEYFLSRHFSIAYDFRCVYLKDKDKWISREKYYDYDKYNFILTGPGLRYYIQKKSNYGFFVSLYFEGFYCKKRTSYCGDEYTSGKYKGYVVTWWGGYRTRNIDDHFFEFSAGIALYSVIKETRDPYEASESKRYSRRKKTGLYLAGAGLGCGFCF